MAWDPIARRLYLPQGAKLPLLEIEPNCTGYEEIALPTVNGDVIHRPSLVEARLLGSPIRY